MSDEAKMKRWEVMKAHEEGAEIEVRVKGFSDWCKCASSPVWNWDKQEYRVKPAPKPPRYVPFTRETWPIGAWVRFGLSVNPVDMQSIGIRSKDVYFGCGYSTYAALLKEAKLLEIRDGKVVGERPCGLEVKE